jgi:hypothetical protein
VKLWNWNVFCVVIVLPVIFFVLIGGPKEKFEESLSEA